MTAEFRPGRKAQGHVLRTIPVEVDREAVPERFQSRARQEGRTRAARHDGFTRKLLHAVGGF